MLRFTSYSAWRSRHYAALAVCPSAVAVRRALWRRRLAERTPAFSQRFRRHSCNIVLDRADVDLYGSPMHNNALIADVQTADLNTADVQTGYANR